ncbi:MAG: dienelactone hydrolase family protein [Acidobacteria bacterium]|nr:dienelactone hydrolase family protein [Acidobacteriota bacterium]MBK8148312.1 dienelactone hydrolase family protein [Acidobacteriota bacterium]MBK8813409.1 dienelactone hydrolase family protein [Acidobacteriota bacterium]
MYPQGNLFIPATVGRLEAIVKEPHGTARGIGLVCHPHPLGGGTMHNKVVFRAAAGLVDAGLVTLRFNFRGVGLSGGEHDGMAEKQDVRDALDYLSANFPGLPITLAGFSFGSRIGNEVGMTDDRVARLISIGTPVDKYDDFDFLEEARKPILFVHGDRDEFGALENVRSLVDRVAENTDAELVWFENCGHFFDSHLTDLRAAVRDWVVRKS